MKNHKMKPFLKLLSALTLTFLAQATPVIAAAAPAEFPRLNPALVKRLDQIPALLKGEVKLPDYFTDSFLAVVTPEQMEGIRKSFLTQYGAPTKIVLVRPTNDFQAIATLMFEKASVQVDIVLDPKAPNKVTGLRFSDVKVTGDTIEKISADFKALPGISGFVLARLDGNGGYQKIAAQNEGQQFAIGSTFKLYILAELAAQIEGGERQWADVVPLSKRSFTSAATGNWPIGMPVTVQTLATQMISVSDNGATDTLLALLGREAVESRLARIGHNAPDRMLPFLSTVEAFALKAPANAVLRAQYLKASEAKQRDLLTANQTRLTLKQIEGAQFTSAPAFIDTIEWFAAPTDIIAVLDHIRAQKSETARTIMAINPGIDPAAARKWRYLGYKGGSESGVVSMSFLARNSQGVWYVASGSWNNVSTAVNGETMAGLMTRLLDMVSR
jgi:beta-lactamase class A